jgi:hypothetical protein
VIYRTCLSMFKTLSQDTKFQIYLSLLALIGLSFILLTTSKYGAGVSSDAARNLSTADSLLAGKGFVDMLGGPFILWPPLYPIVIAGLSLITKWNTFQSAWYLNVGLYSVNIWLSGWFVYLIFKDRIFYAAICALIMLLSRSTLRIYANIASEPLFATLMLSFLFAAAKYLKGGSAGSLWLMFLTAGLATLQRYPGVVLIGVGGLVVLIKYGLGGIRRAVLPVLASLLPVSAWVFLHNYPISGTLFGPRDLGAMLPLENISLSLTKVLWWFIPRLSFLDPLLLRPWIIVAVFTLLLILVNKKTDWLNWLRALSNHYIWPALVFSIIYYFLMAFTIVTADHLDLTSDRYYVVLLPVVLVGLFITLDQLVFSHVNTGNRAFFWGLIGLAAVWFSYPVYSLQGYICQALVEGEPTNYNIANSAQFREMKVVKAALPILEKDPGSIVYSNYVNIVWFIYRHPVETLPFEDATLQGDQRLAALKQNYPAWPPHGGYIIWFTPNQYHHIVAPDELSTIANLSLLYKDKTGEIYYVQAATP